MQHYSTQMSDKSIAVLKTLLGTDIDSFYAPTFFTSHLGNVLQAAQVIFQPNLQIDEYIVLSTTWELTDDGFDYHVFQADRSKQKPQGPKIKGGWLNWSRKLAPPPSRRHAIGVVQKIEIIAAFALTDYRDKRPEAIEYDQCLNFCGTDGNLYLSTQQISVAGFIEIHFGEAPEPTESVETYKIRDVLEL